MGRADGKTREDSAGPGECRPATLEEALAEVERLRRENGRLRGRLEELSRRIEEPERSRERQAAPFSEGPPEAEPAKPGRKAGDAHGRHAHRPPPPTVEETIPVPPPAACDRCGAPVVSTGQTLHRWQTELVIRPLHRRFDIAVGKCSDPKCGCVVRGRHELQTSDALGAAASQLGPVAQAVAAHMNKHLGTGHAKTAEFLSDVLGVKVTRGAVSRIILRAGERCGSAYRDIIAAIRESDHNQADETGWRIGGRPAWLHAVVGKDAAAYAIAQGEGARGGKVAAGIPGPGWKGTLGHDGWKPYDNVPAGDHQQRLAHLLRRRQEMEESSVGGAVHFPRKVKRLLKDAIAAGKTGPPRQESIAELERRLDRLLEHHRDNPSNERLARHLDRCRHQLFTFLRRPGVEPTNWRAEQAMRPAVVNRKVWGGNRTDAGARAQAVLCSLLRTCRQRRADPVAFLARTLRSTPSSRPPLPQA